MGGKRSRGERLTIGMVLRHLAQERVYWEGAAEAAKAHDVNLITFPAGTVWRRGMVTVLNELVSETRLDGLIVVQRWPTPQMLEEMYARYYYPLPLVSVHRAYPGRPGVVTDDAEGMREAVRHLVREHGRRRIAFIRGERSRPSMEARYHAYVQALEAYGVELKEELVIPGDGSRTSGMEAVRVWLDERGLRPGEALDAVIAANDAMALGAMEALRRRKVRVPYEVSVVGFGDSEDGRLATPPLTTVRIPARELGRRAVEMLLALIAEESVPPKLTVSTRLVRRRSCGCFSGTVQGAAICEVALAQPVVRGDLAGVMRRERILADLEGVVGSDVMAEVLPWFDEMWQAMMETVRGQDDKGERFLALLYETVTRLHERGVPVVAWQEMLSRLHRRILPWARQDMEVLCRVEGLWQQARVLVGEVADHVHTQRHARTLHEAERLRSIFRRLLTAETLPMLGEILARALWELEIPGGYLSLFENPDAPAEQARLVLAYTPDGVTTFADGERFPSPWLVPDAFWPRGRRVLWVVKPLYFRDKHLGMVVFEAGEASRGVELYELMSRQIATALQGVLAEAERRQLLNRLERRAIYLQTAAEISRTASSTLDLDTLIQQAVSLIRERFGLYYVGLFLVDESGQWAVLRAGTGDAGKAMVAAGHKLEVGGDSMVGQCIAAREARIAQSVGDVQVRFENTLLPETRSELALPLVSRGRSIGASTIQSDQEAAFTEEDITILQAMADQLANAIENARLYRQAQQEIAERRRVEEELRREEALMEAFMRYIPDYVYFKDRDSRFIRVSWSHVEKFGLKHPDEAVGKTDFDFFAEEHAREAYETEQEILRTGKPLVDVEEREVWPDRPDTWVATTKMPLYDDEGKIIGTFGISRDITRLKQAEAALRRRNLQLQTVAEVSRTATRTLDPDELLWQAVDLIRERLNLYYAGVFLVEETSTIGRGEAGRWAVLRAGSGEVGRKLVAQGHRLKVGGRSMVGQCIATRQARIAQDVTLEEMRRPHPLLPKTRSELALPLIGRGGEVIGALTIQSEEKGAFSEEDVTVLQTMADLLAGAVENARLLEQTQQALAELEEVQHQYQERAWADYLEVAPVTHYEAVRSGVPPLGDKVEPEIRAAVERRRVVTLQEGNRSALVVPIVQRGGAVVGAIGIHDESGERRWTEDEMAVIEAVVERMSIFAERMRLLEQTQRTAARERLTREITARMRASLDLETVLRTAAQEIRAALQTPEVVVQLASPEEVVGGSDDGAEGEEGDEE